MSVFSRFPPRMQEAIVSRLGFTGLRPVQELTARELLDGSNAVVLAPTAGGKTEAALFPILADLMERPVAGVGALYVAPIKALLNNQEERLGIYTEMVGLRRFVWHGDTPDGAKRAFIKEPCELLMTTPESLEVMLISPRVPVQSLFSQLRHVVVDEVHALAGTDRGAHLMSVIERLAALGGGDVQRVGLSATVGNPEDILAWLKGSSRRQGTVVDPPRQPAQRKLSVSLPGTVSDIARAGASLGRGRKSLFFCQTRALTEAVAERMRGQGTDVFVHHSSVSLEERKLAEERFHHGQDACIVCTSTLELGIDVGDLDAVLQANAPSTVSSFLQRIGRTGRRAGQVANMAFLCEDTDSLLVAIALIEQARAGWVEAVPMQSRCWAVLVQQLMALSLQFGAISPVDAWAQLSRVPDFQGISAGEFEALVRHLVATEFLFESGGKLSLGERAERLFGRKNFSELYAVFTSPVMYRVMAGAQELGSIEPAFVERLVEGMSSFLLAGRAWVVERLIHASREVHVRAAPAGRKPTWGGFMPRFLGYEVCQRIRNILEGDTSLAYLDEAAAGALRALREDLGPLLRRVGPAVQLDSDGNALWWNFAGGRINHTLKYALELAHGWKVVPDNFFVRISGAGASHDAVARGLAEGAREAFWSAPGRLQAMAARIPPYRLSKFQDALPPHAVAEMLGGTFLDTEGARRVLASAQPVRP
ncbi:DEAD/DEAH box helicase [Pyxidicoccus fallax]|uniref:DEAD/DEAH box helicase n=1 Tax=Pyxidicoccus fallax TaxID=394095 RepID=A0A848LKB9_9BACT|nr:DEAD/DEAH box helicase [Pyxidicoccus fallax]NMO18158.1 DEAD/DEAH box helicase [Pyxidicoccus fallax]NPC79371.1 DEAD/DEAH box helicase [Pyxidicoccus fallax]